MAERSSASKTGGAADRDLLLGQGQASIDDDLAAVVNERWREGRGAGQQPRQPTPGQRAAEAAERRAEREKGGGQKRKRAVLAIEISDD